MNFLVTSKLLLSSAFADFRRDKIRTFLTSLGIMIGVLSVVILIALGLGLKNYIENQFESLGANMLMILPGSGMGSEGGGFGAPGMLGSAIKFDERDAKSLEKVANIKYMTPMVFKSAIIQSDGEEKGGYIMGSNEEFFPMMGQKVIAGQFWNKTDVGNKSKKGVLGYEIADQLFDDPKDALGKTLRISGIRVKVIGVIDKTGDREQDRAVIVPYTTTFGSINPEKTFFAIYVGVASKDDVAAVTKDIERILLKRYKADDFSVTELSELLKTVNSIFTIINSVLLAIGSISLIVGGIGIMNIMYATVTERTREVGIRRAIGATRRDILLQFMTESVLLSFIGGMTGLLLSIGIVMIMRLWFPAAINLTAVLVAFGVSSAIGIFFGVFPARKAAELSPIEAIRYE